jgi:hypothetical protein
MSDDDSALSGVILSYEDYLHKKSQEGLQNPLSLYSVKEA